MMGGHWRHLTTMPNPEDKHPATLRPTNIKPGRYLLEREQYDTEVNITEPGGDSYCLEFFECERFLRAVLRFEEVTVNKILDTVWSFGSAVFSVDEPDVVTRKA